MSREPKISLGIWALSGMVTRFVPDGYQPEAGAETTAEKVRRAVAGLEGLVDGYEFHYPAELSEDNLDEVREALAGHPIVCVCAGTHLNPRFGKGGLSSPDDETRDAALDEALRGADFAASLGPTSSSGPGSRATTTPSRPPTPRAGRVSSTAWRRSRGAATPAASSSSSSTRTPSRR